MKQTARGSPLHSRKQSPFQSQAHGDIQPIDTRRRSDHNSSSIMRDINSPKSQPDRQVQQRIGSLVVKSKGIGQYLKKVAEQNV